MEFSLPFSGTTPIARHHSALAAEAAAKTRGRRTLEYLELLQQIGPDGVSDHDAARMLGLPLSSINSIRNGCGAHVIPADRECLSPYGRRVTAWRLRCLGEARAGTAVDPRGARGIEEGAPRATD